MEERVPVGGVQVSEVPYARGAMVMMGAQVTANEVEDAGVMSMEVAQRRTYIS